LSFLSDLLGNLTFLIRYLGGAYLLWLGIKTVRARSAHLKPQISPLNQTSASVSQFSSFLTGLLIILADQKATLFYLGFFPAFLDLSQVSYIDAGVIMLVAIATVGRVKIGYALLANRTSAILSPTLRTRLNAIAGCGMMAVGIFLILTAA